MITVNLNRTEFEYDIHSLLKAFFPKEDVEIYYTAEAHADEKNVACTNHFAENANEENVSRFTIHYADDKISIAWDGMPLRLLGTTSNRTDEYSTLENVDDEAVEGPGLRTF